MLFYDRLKTEFDRLTVENEEKYQQAALRHTHELSTLKEQLAESESTKTRQQNDVSFHRIN